MIKYIGILYFLMANYVFDTLSVPKSTGWSVFYFSSVYISLFLITIDDAIHDHGRLTRKIYQAISLVFLMRAIYELCLIRLDYQQYMISANSYSSGILFLVIFILIILTIIIKNWPTWLRNLKNTGK